MKIRKIIAAALIMCTSITMAIPAYASSKDSVLPSEYISSTKYVSTELRNKDNSSYHYIYNKCGIPISVLSYSQSNVNCTKNSYAVIPANSQRFITNYVYEWGYRNCRLTIRGNVGGASVLLKGVWSPDCVGSYPVANP